MKRCYDFLGSQVSSKGRDRVYVIPVPVELTTTYVKGTGSAPEAIISASRQIELYNAALDLDLERSGIVTLRSGIGGKRDVQAFVTENRDLLTGCFPCFIGGEHSITPWILESLGVCNAGIVWIDAHADLRERYEGEAESHACAARNSLAFGRIVEIGVRSYSSEERSFILDSDRIEVFHHWNGDARSALERLPAEVYVSIDYDAIDPSIVRAVGTPEPDGLLWAELMDVLTFVFQRKSVLAMDAVELCPIPGDEASNFIAAKILYEAISRFLIEEARGEKGISD